MAFNSTWMFSTIMYRSTFSLLPESWRWAFGFFMCVLAFLSTVENIFVATLFCKFPVLRNPSNVILMSLAFSGALLGVIAAPLNALQLLRVNIVNDYLVDVVRQYTSTVFIGIYTLTLSLLSFDRCLHMVRLKKYKMCYSAVFSALIPCWVLPMSIPLLCMVRENGSNYFAVILVFGTTMIVAINLSYIGLLYSLRKLYSLGKKQKNIDMLYIENEKHAGVTVFLAVTAFIVLMIPGFNYYALCSIGTYQKVTLAKSYVIGVFSTLLTSAVVPFMYIIRTPPLCKYVKELIPIERNKGQHNNVYAEESFLIEPTFI